MKTNQAPASYGTHPGGIPASRTCTLHVHDDVPIRVDVRMKLAELFPDGQVNVGDVLEIRALNPESDVTDFQRPYSQRAYTQREGNSRRYQSRLKAQRSSTQQDRIVHDTPAVGKTDKSTRFVFDVKPASADPKGPLTGNVQLSISASLAAMFRLRNRSQVLLTKVRGLAITY